MFASHALLSKDFNIHYFDQSCQVGTLAQWSIAVYLRMNLIKMQGYKEVVQDFLVCRWKYKNNCNIGDSKEVARQLDSVSYFPEGFSGLLT